MEEEDPLKLKGFLSTFNVTEICFFFFFFLQTKPGVGFAPWKLMSHLRRHV